MKNHQSVMIPTDKVIVADRLRTIDQDYVELLAASISDLGLMHPIEVAAAGRGGKHRLIAGAHRLAAATLLEMSEIPVVIVSVKGLDAELREIDENLMRRELTPLDRATFLARRKEIHEAKHPGAKHGGDRKSDQVAKSGDLISRFSAEVAEKLGVSERSVQRAIARHSKIAPDVREKIATTWIASKGAVLDALAKEPPETQRAIITELLAEKEPARTVAQATARLRGPSLEQVINADDQQFDALMKAWRKAGQRARDRFVALVNGSDTIEEAA